jgi:hypothetical protein
VEGRTTELEQGKSKTSKYIIIDGFFTSFSVPCIAPYHPIMVWMLSHQCTPQYASDAVEQPRNGDERHDTDCAQHRMPTVFMASRLNSGNVGHIPRTYQATPGNSKTADLPSQYTMATAAANICTCCTDVDFYSVQLSTALLYP